MDYVDQVRQWASLIRDVGIIIGIPVLIAVGRRLYKQQIEILQAKIDLLKETQYDRALAQIRAQKDLFELERHDLKQAIANLDQNLAVRVRESSERSALVTELGSRLKDAEVTITKLQMKEQRLLDIGKAEFNELLQNPQIVAWFKGNFFDGKDTVSRGHYGGWTRGLERFRDESLVLEKRGLCKVQVFDDEHEPSVDIELTERGKRLRDVIAATV